MQTRGKKTDVVLFNTITKIKSKEAKTALKKINLDEYLSTTIIRRKKHIIRQENKNNEILIAKEI